MTQLESELKGRKAQVLYILDKFPDTRNNDFYLELMWMREFSAVPLPWVPYNVIKDLSGVMTTIRRVRQKIQNEDHLFLPTDPNVIEQRRLREEDFRRAIPHV